MQKVVTSKLSTFFTCAALVCLNATMGRAQTAAQPAPDHPAITVQGKTYTPRSIFTRNMGTAEDQTAQFPPHKIIGNIYYVGTRTLSSFLVVTPEGNILICRRCPRGQRGLKRYGGIHQC